MQRVEGYKPSKLALVSATYPNSRAALSFCKAIQLELNEVWNLLTNAKQISRWAPFEPSRDLDELGPLGLTMLDGSKPEQYSGEVIQLCTQKLLKYSWGESVLTWEIERSDKGTLLTLTHDLENPDWLSKAAAGWHICLDIAELAIGGDELPSHLGEAAVELYWEELNEQYDALLSG